MESRQVFHLVCVLSGLVALPPGLRAQETDRIGEQVERYLKQREQPGDLLAGYRDGFFLGTRDGRFRLTLGGRLQTDARFLESGHPSQNTFLVRRARLHLAGHVQERFGFKVEGDLGEGSARLKDGYLNVAFSDRIALRAGQFKEPFGFEELTSSRYVSLVERSLPIDNLAPSRDIGFMVHGKLAGGLLAYQLGAFNGAGDNLMSDANDDKDLALRLSLRPFQSSGKPVLEGLQLGAAATRGNQEGSLAGEAFDTAVGTGFLSFAPGVVQDGRRTRLGAELAWLVGPASLRGEWMQSRFEDLELGATRRDLDLHGWYATATWLLTGEDAALKRVKPARGFEPSGGGLGAFELAARAAALDAEASILAGGFATGSDRATELAVGWNWYLNELVTIRGNYVRTWLDDRIVVGARSFDAEDAVLLRFQIEW